MVAKVILKPRRAKPFWCGEPWVFEGSVERVKSSRDLEDGDVVELIDDRGRTVGYGYWSGRSPIRVRLMTSAEVRLDDTLLRTRLLAAFELRRKILRLDEKGSVYRIIHAEGDGLAGIVADKIGDWIAVQFDHAATWRRREFFFDALEKEFQPRGILVRSSRVAREQEGLEGLEGVFRGDEPEEPIEVIENGVRHLVDVAGGQKTGFYADQRENRRTLANYCGDARVLDAFCYTGAFGLNALVNGGAREVVGVDSSAPALETAGAIARLNGVSSIRFERANVLRYLDHAVKDGAEPFDVVVLDPPKLSPKKSGVRKALRLYQEINEKGLNVLRDGGILATCSCSQSVSEEDFSEMLALAARERGRSLQLLEKAGPGADHPARVPHEASRYLKFRVYRVG